MSRLTDITFRPLDPSEDTPGVASLISSITRSPFTTEQFQGLLRGPAEKVLTVAVHPGNEIIGYGAIVQPEEFPPGRFSLWLGVHPEHRRRGIGTRLFHSAVKAAQEKRVEALCVVVPDTKEDALGFAERVGFTCERRRIRSVANPTKVKLDPETEKALQAEGIQFKSLADLGDTDENRMKVYLLNKETSGDIPGRGPFLSYERYIASRFDSAAYYPEGVILALDESTPVGFTQITGTERSMFLQMTGVDRNYRGRRIGQVLRGLAVQFAKSRGAAEVRTIIDSENVAMLALNRRMGFVDEGETLVLSLATNA